MEIIFDGNISVLYFIAILYILLFDNLKINQKFIIIYIFSYITKFSGIIDLKIMSLMLIVSIFVYYEYLIDDYIKTDILTNFLYKITDFIYKLLFEFSFIPFAISLFIQSAFFNTFLINTLNIDICTTIFRIGNIQINICICLSLFFLILSISFLSMWRYKTNSFTDILTKMNNIIGLTRLEINDSTRLKFNMLSDIEDKSYFVRKNSYSFFTFEFIKYKYNKIKNKITLSFYNNETINISLMKRLLYKITNSFNKFKRLRGYSTIEMQLIRTLGVNTGYGKVFKRKIYEIIYSKIFFKSYRKYCKTNKYRVSCNYKDYLMYCYIFLAPIKINKKTYSNMLEVWNENDINKITNEMFFISILGLSWRPINNDIIDNYSSIISEYNLDVKKLKLLIKKLSK